MFAEEPFRDRDKRVAGVDHGVETLFSPLVYLAHFVVDGTKEFGRASLGRAGDLAWRFNDVAKGTRTFHARNAHLTVSTPFKLPFVIVFSVPARICKEMA